MQVRPAGDTVSVKLTVPVNPFCDVTVIVDVPVAPARMVTLVGLAVTVKVGALPTWNVTDAVWDSVPLVPVTVAR